MIPEDSAADTPDHRAVTPQQSLEWGFFSMGCESLQEPPVRQSSEYSLVEERLEFWAGNLHSGGLVSLPNGLASLVSTYYYRVESGFIRLFPDLTRK